ncbi:MAG TPA: sigma-70 family RNA polymerase sigma factor [Planctomycetota bacterium]|jgi:RNA polymerase sigma-70 factor (ECF subfamily)|nr:sigma-70 family RNA polymerase sigma factor [Planctomycetota bacterium]
MDKQDLEAQIRRVREGDPAGFEAIVRAFEWPLRTWVLSHCPPGGDADDVAQRAFIEAFKRIGEYAAETDFRAWLFAIGRYQLMAEATRLRRTADYHRRYAPIALAEELERRAAAAAAPSDRLDRLRACMGGLNPQAREILGQRYREELPLEEISRRSGRSVGALKKYLFTLRARLHECIARKAATETT